MDGAVMGKSTSEFPINQSSIKLISTARKSIYRSISELISTAKNDEKTGDVVSVHPVCNRMHSICVHVKHPVVHVRVRWIMETLKTPSIHRRLGSATLSQPAFPKDSNPNFPREKSHWDKTVVKTKVKNKQRSK